MEIDRGSVPLVEQRRRVLRTFSDKNCFFNGSDTVSDMMTADEYERLAPEEKEHFAMCVKCGEMFDRRSLDEVL